MDQEEKNLIKKEEIKVDQFATLNKPKKYKSPH